MKRKLILLVVTIVFLVGFGVILHSPPSMIDAVTGATPKSKKAAQASAQLEGSYVLGINMMSDGLDNENTRNKLKELALDDSETNETDLMKTDISFRLYVSETDYPLVSYARPRLEAYLNQLMVRERNKNDVGLEENHGVS